MYLKYKFGGPEVMKSKGNNRQTFLGYADFNLLVFSN